MLKIERWFGYGSLSCRYSGILMMEEIEIVLKKNEFRIFGNFPMEDRNGICPECMEKNTYTPIPPLPQYCTSIMAVVSLNQYTHEDLSLYGSFEKARGNQHRWGYNHDMKILFKHDEYSLLIFILLFPLRVLQAFTIEGLQARNAWMFFTIFANMKTLPHYVMIIIDGVPFYQYPFVDLSFADFFWVSSGP